MVRHRFWAMAVGAILILTVAALAFRSEDGLWIAVGLATALAFGMGLTSLTRWAVGVAFILRRPRMLIAIGIVIAVVGFTSSMALALFVPGVTEGGVTASTYVGAGFLLLGILIAMLPSTLRRYQESKAEIAAIPPATKSSKRFSAFGEAVFAYRSVLRAWPVFLQITGPWVVLTCGAMLLLLGPLATNLDHDQGRATLFLLGLGVFLIVVLYVLIPTVAVAWFRWTLKGERPKFIVVLPDRAIFGLAWRLWLFLTVMGGVDRFITDQAQTLGPMGEDIAWWVVMVIAVAVSSSFALRFPAIAVGDAAFTRSAALIQGRRMWPGLPVGLILSLAPFLILAIAAGYLSDAFVKSDSLASTHPKLTPPLVAEFGVWMLLILAAIASASTLLSRAYLKAKAELTSA